MVSRVQLQKNSLVVGLKGLGVAVNRLSKSNFDLDFDSTVIPGFSVLEIHDQDFYSLLHIFRWSLLYSFGSDPIESTVSNSSSIVSSLFVA
jgi:hypothetical protein